MKRIIIFIIEAILLMAILYVKKNNIEVAADVRVNHVINSICDFLLLFIVIDFISIIVKYTYSKRKKQSINKKDNFHFGVDNISKLLVGITLIVTLFGAFGIDYKSLLTSISIVAAAIAIISKEYVNDFMVGLYFSFSEDFEIGDYVKVELQRGKIIEIGMLKIKILNDDDDVVIIPNSKVYIGEIVNYTKRDFRLMSIDFQLDIKSIENVELLERDLIFSLRSFSEDIEESSYNLKIVEMKKDYLDLKFQYSIKELDREMQRSIRKKTVRTVFNYISSKGYGAN
ncbi:MAG: MscS family membrane protein [Saprospiraceae bacterium]|jgi:MscS family membrane protein